MTTQTTGDQQQRTGHRRQTMEQKRARQAWDNIRFIQKESESRGNDTLQKEYRTRVSQLNSMIQVNGLGATLGFLKSKKGQGKDKQGNPQPPNAYDYLLYHLTRWTSGLFPVTDPGSVTSPMIPPGYDGLLDWITAETTNISDYRRATAECLAFGIWLRRFAEAELKAESAGQATPIEATAGDSEPGEATAPSTDEAAAADQARSVTSSQKGTK